MRTSTELQRDVLNEMKWTPGIDSAGIGVGAHDGVVTLTGHVPSYMAKMDAEKAAKRVRGVKGVANDLTVKLPVSFVRDDTDIAEAAVHALRWHTSIPEDRIKVTVRDGWVTLEGEVDLYYQSEAANRAVRDLTGVLGVTNLIKVKSRATAGAVREKIEAAFKRSAEIDADKVQVEVVGTRAVLRGTVTSWGERQEAEWAAWSAPGITAVENNLSVTEDEFATF